MCVCMYVCMYDRSTQMCIAIWEILVVRIPFFAIGNICSYDYNV